MFKSKNFIIVGVILVTVGALLKILKVEQSNIIVLVGLGVEIFGLYKFFTERKVGNSA